jgi:hypothetical protein
LQKLVLLLLYRQHRVQVRFLEPHLAQNVAKEDADRVLNRLLLLICQEAGADGGGG